MTLNHTARALLPVALALMAVSGAGANTIFTLDHDGCTGTCGLGPFATVTLVQTAANAIEVTEVLAISEVFAGTGAGQALEFNVRSPVVITDLTAGFSVGPSRAEASAFGDFMYSVRCTACRGGKLSNPSGPLSFTIISPIGLSIADFLPNDRGYYFASDIRGKNGRTGNVASSSGVYSPPYTGPPGDGTLQQGVPEPMTGLLIGGGLVGLGLLGRRALARSDAASRRQDPREREGDFPLSRRLPVKQ